MTTIFNKVNLIIFLIGGLSFIQYSIKSFNNQIEVMAANFSDQDYKDSKVIIDESKKKLEGINAKCLRIDSDSYNKLTMTILGFIRILVLKDIQKKEVLYTI